MHIGPIIEVVLRQIHPFVMLWNKIEWVQSSRYMDVIDAV